MAAVFVMELFNFPWSIHPLSICSYYILLLFYALHINYYDHYFPLASLFIIKLSCSASYVNGRALCAALHGFYVSLLDAIAPDPMLYEREARGKYGYHNG